VLLVIVAERRACDAPSEPSVGSMGLRRHSGTVLHSKVWAHTKMDSTVRYLGVELEDALAIAEAIEI
jgi:hypothetical protein